MSDDLALYAPVEGDGYYGSKAMQWVDLCPHMGAPEKILLRVLTNLTTEASKVRRLKPVELQQMVFTGPVEIGEEPKHVSASGLLRLLRNLASLGQITGPRGEALTFSSRPNAQARETSMAIWKQPRHDCGCPRNTFDALTITRGKRPDYPPASNIAGRNWANTPSDVPGQLLNPPGQEVNPPGQEVNPRGQKVNPHTQRDLQEDGPPSSSSCTSPSSSSSGAPQVAHEQAEEEEEMPSAPTSGSPSADLIRSLTDATEDEAAALVEIIRPKVKHTLSGLIRTMAERDDLGQQLWSLRRQRASEAHAAASAGAGPDKVCAKHHAPLDCPVCATVPLVVAKDLLAQFGPVRRPDLARRLGVLTGASA